MKRACEVLSFFFEYSHRFFGLRVLNAMHLHLYIATSASPFPESYALFKLLHSLVENSEFAEQDEKVTLLALLRRSLLRCATILGGPVGVSLKGDGSEYFLDFRFSKALWAELL